jgi:HD-like signal output (HDOD) protein
MNEEVILEKVKAFPPLDDTVTKVMAVCNDEDGSLYDLTRIIEGDPMTMANILKAANSPMYGFSREIKGIAQAISIFGMDTVKGFAFSSFLQKKFDLNLSPYGIDKIKFTEITEQHSAFVSLWYKGQKSKLDILILASFLMEMGKIVLSNIVIENKKESEFKSRIDSVKSLEELSSLERDIFGITNEEITAIVFKGWNFNDVMSNSLKFLNNPELASVEVKEYAQILQIVKTLIPAQKFDKEEAIQKAQALVEQYGLNIENFTKVVEEFFKIELSV